MIDFDDFARAAEALDKQHFGAVAGRHVASVLRKGAVVVQKNTRKEAAAHRRTGKMRGNIRYKVKGRGLDTVATVKATGAVANLVVGGVRPHTITAGGRLMPIYGGTGAWKGGAGRGITGFATVVEHPGFPADPFFRRGVRKSAGEIQSIINAAADAMAAELTRRMEGRR